MSASFVLREQPTAANHRQECNDAWLRAQQSRLGQALSGDHVALNDIYRHPTAVRTLHAWRATFGRDARFSHVVLVLVLEEILVYHHHQSNNNATPLQWKDLEVAWRELLARDSALHLIVDAGKLQFADGRTLDTTPGPSLWTLPSRLHQALRIQSQPVSVDEEERPWKRRRLGGTTTIAQQAVATVLVMWLSRLDGRLLAANETNSTRMKRQTARWGILTTGWSTKLEESIQLADWTMALMTTNGQVATVQDLLQLRPE